MPTTAPLPTGTAIRALRRVVRDAIHEAGEAAARDLPIDGGEWSTPAAYRTADARIRIATRRLGLDVATAIRALVDAARAEAPHAGTGIPSAHHEASALEEAFS